MLNKEGFYINIGRKGQSAMIFIIDWLDMIQDYLFHSVNYCFIYNVQK